MSRRPRANATGGDNGRSNKELPNRETLQMPENVPPLPELAAFVDIGLTKITRVLAENACPSLQTDKDGGHAAQSASTQPPELSPYSIIFVARSGHPSVFYSHFPQMVAVASHSRKRTSTDSLDACVGSPSSIMDPIRLVGFSHGCEDRLSACLGIPHVSSIALRAGATQSQGLVDFVRGRVPPVEIQWLQEARAGDYRKTHIHMAEVTVGPKKKKV
ncbi:hypothetical protein CMQ_7233 [Grosmannia clavigera kw1407]|uniref:Uncharacterized protein n=1 Tax=Grosmannia clavigera (strain kw1407 / UAMH 11150) TaxID=655863 RepID=F0XNJ3_GROCL|nr:uncharacterized protein CMQ_7233 [Grosmannia clavigera kw1407]EFX00231.1 hypothetical protein CMQ_7233 [Grosmannia clavigera kw1407]